MLGLGLDAGHGRVHARVGVAKLSNLEDLKTSSCPRAWVLRVYAEFAEKFDQLCVYARGVSRFEKCQNTGVYSVFQLPARRGVVYVVFANVQQ